MSIVKTTSDHPPEMLIEFDPYLLEEEPERTCREIITRIIPLSWKKIRPQDVKKQYQFECLMEEFENLYERKTNEKTDYDEKIRKKAEKMPLISTESQTIRFKRLAPLQLLK